MDVELTFFSLCFEGNLVAEHTRRKRQKSVRITPYTGSRGYDEFVLFWDKTRRVILQFEGYF